MVEEEYFNVQFGTYDEKFGNSWGMNWRSYMKLRAEKAKTKCCNIIRENKRCKILELGCATGDFTTSIMNCIIECEWDYLGGDISEVAIDICRKKFREFQPFRFVKMVLPSIPTEESFDCIVCMDIFEYFSINERVESLKSIYMHLNKGGKIIFQIPLEGEREEEVIPLFNEWFQNINIDYVYGDIWFRWMEKPLVRLVDELLRRKIFGVLGIPIGKIAYKICSSYKLVKRAFDFNERFFPEKKSHMIIIGERKE